MDYTILKKELKKMKIFTTDYRPTDLVACRINLVYTVT